MLAEKSQDIDRKTCQEVSTEVQSGNTSTCSQVVKGKGEKNLVIEDRSNVSHSSLQELENLIDTPVLLERDMSRFTPKEVNNKINTAKQKRPAMKKQGKLPATGNDNNKLMEQ